MHPDERESDVQWGGGDEEKDRQEGGRIGREKERRLKDGQEGEKTSGRMGRKGEITSGRMGTGQLNKM